MHTASKITAAQLTKLIGNGADVNVKNSGIPILFWPVHYGAADIVKLMVAKGSDPNATTYGGTTVLMQACRDGNASCASALLSKWYQTEFGRQSWLDGTYICGFIWKR